MTLVFCTLLFEKSRVPNFFSVSQTDPGFQNKNSGCRLTGRMGLFFVELVWAIIRAVALGKKFSLDMMTEQIYTNLTLQLQPHVGPESTKQMEQTLRAKVKIFFKSENLKNAFNKK